MIAMLGVCLRKMTWVLWFRVRRIRLYNEVFERNFVCVATSDCIPEDSILRMEPEVEKSVEDDGENDIADNVTIGIN
jgi:hypothetical protein